MKEEQVEFKALEILEKCIKYLINCTVNMTSSTQAVKLHNRSQYRVTKPLKYCKPNRPNVFLPLTAYQKKKKMMSFCADFNYNNCPFHFHKLRTRNQHEACK